MKSWLIYIIIILAVALLAMGSQVKLANARWKTAEANVKSYSQLLSKEGQKSTALQLTIEQLGYFKDSVLQELDNTRKELKIKDRYLKALQQVKSTFSKIDTIKITQTDTLFREPSISVDTLLGDEWYSLRLGLIYPSTIAVEPYFKSEKYIIVSSKKETVNPPKKFFLFRWFQKKMTVVHVDVVEKNPYVGNECSRYVKIIR